MFRKTGELRLDYRLIRGAFKIMKAQLLAEDGVTYVLPVLDQAKLVQIGRTGMLISGKEVIPVGRGAKNQQSIDYPQSWYCVPHYLDVKSMAEPDPTRARASAKRLAEVDEHHRWTADEIGATMNNMYSRRRS